MQCAWARGYYLICSIRVTPSRASLRRKVVMHARLKLGSVCSIVYVCSKHGKVQYLTRFIISDCVSVHVRYMITYDTRGPHPSGFPDGLFRHRAAASSFFSFCFFKTPPDESMKESTATVTSQKKFTRLPSGGCGCHVPLIFWCRAIFYSRPMAPARSQRRCGFG